MVYFNKSASGTSVAIIAALSAIFSGCEPQVYEDVYDSSESAQDSAQNSAQDSASLSSSGSEVRLKEHKQMLASSTLSETGVSQLAWPFEETTEWRMSGSGVGEGYHLGDDYYFDDWNWQSGNSDIGKPTLSPIEGEVIFAGRGGVSGYGNQVVIRSGAFAYRIAHLDRVDVKVGDRVKPGTPIGTVGCSGLSCVSPGTAHAHLGLYRNLGSTQLTRLGEGRSPSMISGGATTFAAPFNVDSGRRAEFTIDMAASRLSPVLRELTLPQQMTAGRSYQARWQVMGYHGKLAGAMQIKCGTRLIVSALDDTPTDEGQGWRWSHIYSRLSSYSVTFTVPSDLSTQDCEVRFFWRKIARRGEREEGVEQVADYLKVFISVLIPGGVDPSTMGTEGRKLRRRIVAGDATNVSGTRDQISSVSVTPTLEQAASRLSPVIRLIDLDDQISGRVPVSWEVMGYHGPMTSLVKLICPQGDARLLDETPTAVRDGWSWSGAQSTVYRFSGSLDIPSHFEGECSVRFFWSRAGSTDHNRHLISVLIPGGVDGRPDGDAGRVIRRTVR